jgi:Ca2+-transporting ATPase
MNRSKNGLTSEQVRMFGTGRNVLTPPPSISWWEMLLDKFKDPILIILIIADIFSFIVNIIQKEPLWEPLAILAAILITAGVGFWQDWSAKKQFDSLNKVSDDELIKVIREGKVTEVPKCDLCPGDVVILSAGDEIPADIELFEAVDLHVDEAAMTGESVPVTKLDHEEGNPTIPSNHALRGTNVTEGSGKGWVIAVGDNTEIGKTTRQAMEMTDEKTPLTVQLENLAGKISKLSFWIAGLLLLFLNIHHFGFTEFNSEWHSILATELKFIMISVVIVIAAVPEGLALSVVLALSYSVKAMMKDNNLVKKMKATETVGAVNIVFSDKTGTLTQNKMKVVDTDEVCTQLMALNGSVNSTANINGDKVIGNPTEGAILQWIDESTGYKYETTRNVCEIRSQKPFNSTDKYMSTVIADTNSKPVRGKLKDFVLVKGAPEVVCKLIMDTSDKRSDDYEINLMKVLGHVMDQQKRGRRAISFASGPDMDHLRYDGSVFIEDPVREDVPGAVANCYKAGVDVIMMTGDNVKTAAEIARQAGFRSELGLLKVTKSNEGEIITEKFEENEIFAIEAKDWLGFSENDEFRYGGISYNYPNVIARCKPEDKLRIMKDFQNAGYICAMTGDGVNDSPSLNHANVGIAMGSGTSVAKEAADIVLLDDAFPSIVKGIKWGRSLYKNIQSFLAFQLTVNVALCLTALMGPLLGIDSPFSVIEILYINLVMDALGALALASEPAMDKVLDEKPRDNSEFIINKSMMKMILSTGIPLFLTMILMILDTSKGWNIFSIGETGLFATFMTINWMNLFRARSFGKGIGVFSSLGRNKLFLGVSSAILVMNILIVQFGGSIFGTKGLDLLQWMEVGILSLMVIVISGITNKIIK